MHVAIINNRDGLEVAQMQPKGRSSSGIPILGDLVTLIPGLNLIPAEQHDALMKNPAWSLKFKTKIPRMSAPEQDPERVGRPILEVASFLGKEGNGQVDDKAPLKNLKGEQALKMIDETLSTALLKTWLYEESRPEIRMPIEKKIQELTTGNPVSAASAGR